MGRHKWIKLKGCYQCENCNCQKYRTSTRLLMAITPDGKNHYKYIQHWEYIPLNKDVTKTLPKCFNEKEKNDFYKKKIEYLEKELNETNEIYSIRTKDLVEQIISLNNVIADLKNIKK